MVMIRSTLSVDCRRRTYDKSGVSNWKGLLLSLNGWGRRTEDSEVVERKDRKKNSIAKVEHSRRNRFYYNRWCRRTVVARRGGSRNNAR